MSADRSQLRSLLNLLLAGEAPETSIAELVHLSRILVQAHLGIARSSTLAICLNQGLTVEDLAYDCIAEMFARDESGRFPKISAFVESLPCTFDEIPDGDLFIKFRALLNRIADAQVARLFAQADPAGAKIHRNILEYAKESADFEIRRDFRGLVLYTKKCVALDELPERDLDQLESLISVRVPGGGTIPVIMRALGEILQEQREFRRSISVIDLVKVIRRFYRGMVDSNDDESVDPLLSGLSEFEVARMRSEVQIVVNERILLTYLGHGKVDRRQAEAMAHALEDLLSDWCRSDGESTTLLTYLSRHIDVDQAAYMSTYRAKMEYLRKVAREEFASRLMREL